MLIRECAVCGKEFHVPSHHDETAKYCSRQCQNKGRIDRHPSSETREKMRQANLGRHHSEATRAKMSCSRKGKKKSASWLEKVSGQNSQNWKGGRTISGGYFFVHFKGHPNAHNGYVAEHRLVAEKALGRFLRTSESVHHINGQKRDNRSRNLVICQDEAYHQYLHLRMRAISRENNVH